MEVGGKKELKRKKGGDHQGKALEKRVSNKMTFSPNLKDPSKGGGEKIGKVGKAKGGKNSFGETFQGFWGMRRILKGNVRMLEKKSTPWSEGGDARGESC